MYGPPHASMNDTTADHLRHHHLRHHQDTTHIDEEEDENDVVPCSNGDEPLENPPSHIGYDPPNNSHSPHALAIMESPVEASGPHALYASDIAPHEDPAVGEGGADQLTLSFQGEVYVFDSVSPEKVQAVLLLLGGYEVPPTGIPTPGMTPQNPRGNVGDYPARSSQPERAASLNRFREKRKERCFEKKIRYTVRKEVALRMQRKKGQFTSSKSVGDELGSPSTDWNGTSGGQEEQETLCRHCGNSSKSTPMMRRGPDGPRTLCNACGLKWANKGVLRDLSKVPITGVHNHLNGEANGGDTVLPSNNVITSSSGDN
ncbi:gata transcription factor 24 [Phtheirospermum japonicum]|uniref:Gata transcription factor 24 n=1 Tax=Phtheirospermum japonicum TaxID=374723 RepID=A0A830BXM0_9LAMI|nr:gata transcription factor 24 [Phtheirospermum japonicum]